MAVMNPGDGTTVRNRHIWLAATSLVSGLMFPATAARAADAQPAPAGTAPSATGEQGAAAGPSATAAPAAANEEEQERHGKEHDAQYDHKVFHDPRIGVACVFGTGLLKKKRLGPHAEGLYE